MMTNFMKPFAGFGVLTTSMALNMLNPSTASAQVPGDPNKAPQGDGLSFNPQNIPYNSLYAGIYSTRLSGVTIRDDESNHSSKPIEFKDLKDELCKEDGDVCADLSKYVGTYVADWIGLADTLKAVKQCDKKALDQCTTEVTYKGQTFHIPRKEEETDKDTLFSEDLRYYVEIYQAMDAADGQVDGIVHGSGMGKFLPKKSPELAKLLSKINLDYVGRRETDFSREVYLVTAPQHLASLTKIVYEGRESMVKGYVPQEELDETQKKLDEANGEIEKNKKKIGDLRNSKDAAEAKIRRYEEIFKYSSIGAGSLLALGLLIMIGLRLRKARSQATPAPKTELKSKTETKTEAPEPKTEPKSEPKKTEPESKPKPDDAGFLDDIDLALGEAKSQQTPPAPAQPQPAEAKPEESQPPAPESV
ncbi:MAG TPA: hypothetical protein VFX30_11390 [bacterium]|nr:hypothetical protein [bacterium]